MTIEKPPARQPILQATNISQSFYKPTKITILNQINLTVYPGETVAISGRSGQGKSTLLHILGTLEKPCTGQLEIAGQLVSLWNKSQIRNQQIAFIFQSFHLMEDYTVLENVLLPAAIGRQNISKGSLAYLTALTLLEQVGLQDRCHFNTKLLSGGEKQRVAIARALCNNPAIIFADEPSGNLDQQTSQTIHELLLNYATQSHKTLITVTHNAELARLCQQHYSLENGELLKN